MAKAKLLFMENKGQLRDMEGKLHPEVLFTARSGSTNILISNHGLQYVFTKRERIQKPAEKDSKNELQTDSMVNTSATFTLLLEGANPNAEMVREKANNYHETYYLPHCREGITAESFEKVRFKNVYPGIDWVLYSNGQSIKYDFVLDKAAKAKQIKLRINNAKTAITTEGELLMQTDLGEVREASPLSYQNKKEVKTVFVKNRDGSFGFKLDKVISGQPVVIDPSVVWSTYFGGDSDEDNGACVTGNTGEIYVAGTTFSAYWTYGNNLLDLNLNGNPQTGSSYWGIPYQTVPTKGAAFISKFNKIGAAEWMVVLDGDDFDAGTGCTLSPNEDYVYLSGFTQSTMSSLNGFVNFLNINNSQTYDPGNPNVNSRDLLLAKINTNNGGLAWGKRFGGSKTEASGEFSGNNSYGIGIVSCNTEPSTGNVYVVSNTNSADFPINNATLLTNQTSVTNTTIGDNYDFAILKLDQSGGIVWSTQLGGNMKEIVGGSAVDSYGNLAITGVSYCFDHTASNSIILPYPPNSVNYFGDSYFNWNGTILDKKTYVAKFLANGNLSWGRVLGFLSQEQPAGGCAIGADNDVFVAGNSIGEYDNVNQYWVFPVRIWVPDNGDSDSQTFRQGNGSGPRSDGTIAKLDGTSGYTKWARFFGKSGAITTWGCATDYAGGVSVYGETNSIDFPTTPDALQRQIAGGTDGYLIRFNQDAGEITYGTYYGAAGYEKMTYYSNNNHDDEYFVLTSNSTGFTAVNNTFLQGSSTVNNAIWQNNRAGTTLNTDFFILKTKPPKFPKLISGTTTCIKEGQPITLTGLFLDQPHSITMGSNSVTVDVPTTTGAGTTTDPTIFSINIHPPTHLPPGTYNINFVGKYGTVTFNDYPITILPDPIITPNPVGPVCDPAGITLYVPAPPTGTDVLWNGYVSNQCSASVCSLYVDHFTGTNTYTASYALNGCTVQGPPVTVTINYSPQTPSYVGSTSSQTCPNGSFTLTAPQVAAGETYVWGTVDANRNNFTALNAQPVPINILSLPITANMYYSLYTVTQQGCSSEIAAPYKVSINCPTIGYFEPQCGFPGTKITIYGSNLQCMANNGGGVYFGTDQYGWFHAPTLLLPLAIPSYVDPAGTFIEVEVPPGSRSGYVGLYFNQLHNELSKTCNSINNNDFEALPGFTYHDNVQFDISPANPTVCEGKPLTLWATPRTQPSANAKYLWKYDIYDAQGIFLRSNFFPIATSPTITTSAPHLNQDETILYRIALVYDNINTGTCTSSFHDYVEVTINPKPDAPKINQTGPINVCPGDPGYLTVQNALANTNYHWYLDGNYFASTTNLSPNCTVTVAGTYTVIAEYTGTGCSSDASTGVVAQLIPANTNIWTGGFSRNWSDDNNWNNGMGWGPTACENVVISRRNMGTSTNFPIVDVAAGCNSVFVDEGSELIINQPLSIYGTNNDDNGLLLGPNAHVKLGSDLYMFGSSGHFRLMVNQLGSNLEGPGTLHFNGNNDQQINGGDHGGGHVSVGTLEIKMQDPNAVVYVGNEGNIKMNVTKAVNLVSGKLNTSLISETDPTGKDYETPTLILKSDNTGTALINDFGSYRDANGNEIQYTGVFDDDNNGFDDNNPVRIERYLPSQNGQFPINHLISSPFEASVYQYAAGGNIPNNGVSPNPLPLYWAQQSNANYAPQDIDCNIYLMYQDESQPNFNPTQGVGCRDDFGHSPGNCYAFSFTNEATYFQDGKPNTSPSDGSGGYLNQLTVSISPNNLNVSGDQFTIIGNPYPSPILWSKVQNAGQLAAYIYDPINDNLNVLYQRVSSNQGIDNIGVGQGLLVKRLINNTVDLVFDNSCRIADPTVSFYRLPALEQSLRLRLEREGIQENLIIYGRDAALVGNDKYDAPYLDLKNGKPVFSSGNGLSINALPLNFRGSVPLNIAVKEPAQYTLNITELNNVHVSLEDKKFKTLKALDPDLPLMLQVDTKDQNRFVLHYGPQTPSKVQIFSAEKLVNVILPEEGPALIEAVNTLGQVIKTIESNTQINQFTLPHDGVYIIRVRNTAGVSTTKIMY